MHDASCQEYDTFSGGESRAVGRSEEQLVPEELQGLSSVQKRHKSRPSSRGHTSLSHTAAKLSQLSILRLENFTQLVLSPTQCIPGYNSPTPGMPLCGSTGTSAHPFRPSGKLSG
jgi:hypothetical protein